VVRTDCRCRADLLLFDSFASVLTLLFFDHIEWRDQRAITHSEIHASLPVDGKLVSCNVQCGFFNLQASSQGVNCDSTIGGERMFHLSRDMRTSFCPGGFTCEAIAVFNFVATTWSRTAGFCNDQMTYLSLDTRILFQFMWLLAAPHS
jgi:hypothetical protein